MTLRCGEEEVRGGAGRSPSSEGQGDAARPVRSAGQHTANNKFHDLSEKGKKDMGH